MKVRIAVYLGLGAIALLLSPPVFRMFSAYYRASQSPQPHQLLQEKAPDKGASRTYVCPENALAGFDLSENHSVSEKETLAAYGTSCPGKDNDGHTRSYFYSSSRGVQLKLDFEQDRLVNVEVAKLPIAKTECSPLRNFSALSSGKGLNLGDKAEAVRKIYGEPHFLGRDPENPLNSQMLYSDIRTYSSAPPEAVPPGHAFRVVLSSGTVISMQLITGE